MRYILQISLILLLSLCFTLCLKQRNILFNEFKDKTKSLDYINVWRNKLKTEFMSDLQKLPQNVKTAIITAADDQLKKSWVPLTAMDYLDFKITGNRFYESKPLDRNRRLMEFVMAELIAPNDKYLNEVANGLWLTLEESTWAQPAHLYEQKAGVGLPDPTQNIIDLGVGERSAFISWLGFLIDDKLEKLSPMLVKRIDYELNRRTFDIYLKHEFWWTGLEGQKENNWNPWINSNILISALLNLKNETQRFEIINRTVKSVDDWLNWYGDDGGCDEGPGYWGAAGGRFIQYLYYLSSASNNQLNWSSNELINNIGSFIYKAHIDGPYFVNFADADAKVIPDPNVVYSYGQTLNNKIMKEFGSYLFRLKGNDSYLIGDALSGGLHQFYLQMSAVPLLKEATPKAPQPLESWLPNLEVLTLRSNEGSAKGLFLGAKAGNNDESHNHNDIGNFILYVDGKPAIIDVGGGTYTAKYFSKDRYTIWNLQSQWHNTPTINGVQQQAGPTFKAKNVSYEKSVFEADISGAYPKEAHVDSWVRKLTFNRTSNSVELSETYKLNKFVEPFKIHFVTVLNTTLDQTKGQVLFEEKDIKLTLKLDNTLFDVIIDKPNNSDSKITKEWNNRIQRVSLVSKHKELNGKHSISLHL